MRRALTSLPTWTVKSASCFVSRRVSALEVLHSAANSLRISATSSARPGPSTYSTRKACSSQATSRSPFTMKCPQSEVRRCSSMP